METGTQYVGTYTHPARLHREQAGEKPRNRSDGAKGDGDG